MSFNVLVNGERKFVCGFDGEGFVGVHITAETPEREAGVAGKGYKTLSPAETEFIDWGRVALAPNDVVTVTFDTSSAGSEPITRRSSRSDTRICIRNLETAVHVEQLTRAFERQIIEALGSVAETESVSDVVIFKRAVGEVLATLGEHILGPIYNEHPALRPQGLQGVNL